MIHGCFSVPAFVLAAFVVNAHATPIQEPLLVPSSSSSLSSPASTLPRPLRGRFLHITDIHPDPLYTFNATLSSTCHRLPAKRKEKVQEDANGEEEVKPEPEEERAGYWGAPRSGCDSSIRFVNWTMDWLEENWADEIDFVIWTGDSARHDEDRLAPRTLDEIFSTNRYMAQRMESIFTQRGIPVVPALGNNDIWPHNILEGGPSQITNEYADIWQSFIPFSSYQVFQRGAYFSTDIIPNQVGAISLNTLYFYEKNKVVDGCKYKDKNDPGNLELDWMDVQLNLFRERGMKVWIVGHVPPTSQHYFPECYRRYTELSLRFQDTILGHLYGHLNFDFFFFLKGEDLVREPGSDSISIQKKAKPHKELKKVFEGLPKLSKIDMDEWAVVNVAPSVVANPYVPAFRVFSYNTSGEANKASAAKQKKHRHGEKPEECKKWNEDSWACRGPHERWHSDADAPSRRNTLWTPLGFAQFWMPDMGDESRKPAWELEYVTYEASALRRDESETEGPIPRRLLPRELREGNTTEAAAAAKKYAPYEMADMTIPSWLALARRMGKKKKLWKKFKEYMYMAE